MIPWLGKVVLVTNCDSQIGINIIDNLIENDIKVIGIANNKNGDQHTKSFGTKLKIKNPKENLVIYSCNFFDVNEVASKITKIAEKNEDIDILINIINCDEEVYVSNADLTTFKYQTDGYITANVAFINSIAKSMIQRNTRGHIVNITETRPFRKNAIYKTSMAAISSVNEILRHEFRYFTANIKTTLIEVEYDSALGNSLDTSNVAAKHISDVVINVINTPENVQIHEIQLIADTFSN